MTRISERLGQNRVRLYGFLIISAAAIAFLSSARFSGIFACQSPDNPAEEYLAHCNVTNYGDYDHGAFWHDLEPSAIKAATSAKVLFVGNSRMQFALSTDEFDNWFNAQEHSYYLLGFSHNENHRFFSSLLEKIRPEARMFVLNVDDLFADKLTGPANDVMYGGESANRYSQKKYWQYVHSVICGEFSAICGHEMSFVRKKKNGAWSFNGAEFLRQNGSAENAVQYDTSTAPGHVESYIARASDFLQLISAAEYCVVLMNTPGSTTSAGTVDAIADALRLPLVAPRVEGLRTFDGSHLDVNSASRWSAVFVSELAPYVRQCLG